jgi:hypothetical protein
MEAEGFAAQDQNGSSASWTPAADGAASAGQAVDLLPNVGAVWNSNVETTSPRVDFQVNFTSTGNFKLYIRGAGASRDDDACWGGIDDDHIRQALVPSADGTYQWAYRNVNVSTPGIHTVSLWGFEDGIRVDKVVLTNGAAPSGLGPAESPRQ